MFLQCHYFSHVLMTNVEVNVVIPTPEGNEQITGEEKSDRYDYEGGLPVVYLLHGAYGDNNSWMRFSSVERVAQAHNCIAVMAGVANSFYQDMVHGPKYETFMSKELPAYVQALFPASKERAKTFIAGFSMGGYGAYYLALSHPEKYAKCASMSGALDIAMLIQAAKSGAVDNPFPLSEIFADPDHLEGTDKDLFALVSKDLSAGNLPKLYQACGSEDFLFEMNRIAYGKFQKLGARVTYEEVTGYGHEWNFWDMQIGKIFDWFLED